MKRRDETILVNHELIRKIAVANLCESRKDYCSYSVTRCANAAVFLRHDVIEEGHIFMKDSRQMATFVKMGLQESSKKQLFLSVNLSVLLARLGQTKARLLPVLGAVTRK
ncbi:hypothetical protein M514_05821 [Trichuris suis]|uniref:Uncharacterized protein n=1 Tax=Trichuris suis TaxID=68888 RepID=A0A085NAD9_9BILA|nr:hypothetical protein M513_05821 [Trichuris suis]KFD66435.1 hypothetical protein M514_05821 [Trichuris suis]